MIDSLVLPLSNFDLAAFVAACRKFYREWSGEDSLICFVVGLERYGDAPSGFLSEEVEDEEKAIWDALVEDGLKLFFMMHEPPADEQFLCIDGTKQKSDAIDIGVSDGYGFLVEVEGEKISLHPALYDGSSSPFPQLTLQGTCSVLETPMMEFLNKFVRK